MSYVSCKLDVGFATYNDSKILLAFCRHIRFLDFFKNVFPQALQHFTMSRKQQWKF